MYGDLINEKDKDNNNIGITIGITGTNNNAFGLGIPYIIGGLLKEENNKKIILI